MESTVHPAGMYRFGPFVLDARTGELTNASTRLRLREQPLQLLLALLERPGELVTRDELTSRLWPAGTFVDFDRGLNKAINHLRETLGDSAVTPRFVETLPRKGYRFIAPVAHDRRDGKHEHRSGGDSPPRRTRPLIPLTAAALAIVVGVLGAVGLATRVMSRWSTVSSISAIAVLPLENLSHDPEQEYFADGMTDALITDLARMGSLKVTSRTSVMRYKGTKKNIQEIGRELNADVIVEGTVTRSGSRVRITVQLIQVSTDTHLWAGSYEGDLREVLGLQSAVATDVARRISAVVKPVEHPRFVNPEAYGYYLKGRYSFHRYTSEGWQQAIQHFNRAIEADAGFAPAYSGLAEVYVVAGAYGAIPEDEALTLGKAAAAKALELDEMLASPHYVLATVHTWYDWDPAAAEREFRRALTLNPNDALGRNWHGGYLSLRGLHQEAIEEHRHAVELDPFSAIANANLARALYWARRYDEAIAQARKTLEIEPRFGVALLWLEGALRHKGLLKEAVALRQRVATPEDARIIGERFEREGFQAILRQTAETFRRSGALVVAARCYAQLGDNEQALTLLEACAKRRCSSLVNLPIEPDFDRLRAEPRFERLVRLIGAL